MRRTVISHLKHIRNRIQAYTIVEVTVVTIIISILAMIVTLSSTIVQRQSRDGERSAKSSLIANSLEKYYEENGEYPSVAAIANQNANNVKAKLGLVNPDSLIFPLNTNTTNTSIVAANPTTSQVAYLASTTDPAANTQCQSDVNGYCDAFELRYSREADGQAVIIKSKNNSFVPAVEPCTSGCLAPPSTPTVSGSAVSPTSIVLTSSAVTCTVGTPEYRIRHAPSAATLPAWTTETWSTSRTKNVNPGSNTTIYFQAAARCVGGGDTSADSVSTVQSVNAGTPPAAPTVSASAVSSSQIQVSWSSVSGASSYTVTGAGTASSCTSSPCTVSGLSASTYYSFSVTATNAFGTGPAGSAGATTQAPPCTTGTPSISVSGTSTSAISISWAAVSGSGTVTYYVYYGTTSSASNYWGSTTGTSSTVSGLPSSTTHYLRIYASSDCGSSGYSNTVTATTQTPCSVPSAPSGLSASVASSSQINVSWGSSSGTSPISYSLTRNGSSLGSVSANSSRNDTGLSPSTTYNYTLTATNSCGSAQSNVSATTTAAPCPTVSPISSLTSSGLSTSSIRINWGSSPTPGATYTLSGTNVNTTVSANSSMDVTGLSSNTSYTFTITVSVTCGSPSTSSSTSASTYTTSLSVNASDVAGASGQSVSWSPSGAAPGTTNYTISTTRPASGCGSTSATSCSYDYGKCLGATPSVTVSSAYGASGTDSSNAWPGMPASPGASIQNKWHDAIRVSWSQGGQTTYSQMRYKKSSSSSWSSVSDSLSSPGTASSLAANTPYDLAVYNSNCRYKHCDTLNSNCDGDAYLSAPGSTLNNRSTCLNSANSPC